MVTFDLVYNPEVGGCISNSKGEQLAAIKGDYYKWHGGLAHRIIWEMFNGKIPDGMLVDHINRDKLDNRIENLRLATKGQNSHNVVRTRADGLPSGIVKRLTGYKAILTINKETLTKTLPTLEEAILWRNEIGRKLVGEYYIDIYA